MILVLRKTSVKRTVCIATLLILLGMALTNPFKANASQSNLFYLYPYPSNNPMNTTLFWSEADPSMGAYNLGMWRSLQPNKTLVIGLPEGYAVNASVLGRNGGGIDKYSQVITTRLKKKLQDRFNPSAPSAPKIPKESLTYEREITPEGAIKEKVKVEIVDHFKNNDNFDKFMDSIKKNLTKKNEIPDPKPTPAPEVPSPTPNNSNDDTAQAVQLFGNTLILGGTALMALKLIPLLL